MGRNLVRINENKTIVFGFDAPCNGYFAEYYDKTKEIDGDEPVDQIGFFEGVSKNKILDFFQKHDCVEIVKKQKPQAFENLILDLPC